MRIGTWNLENLFRPGPGGPSTDAVYQAKLDKLAATITVLAPDVLAVQEVGDPAALADLAARVGGGWHVQTAAPDGRGIRVGLLSRLELTAVGQVSVFPPGLRPIQIDDTTVDTAAMGRPALHAQDHVGDRTVDVITTHLKSKLLTFPGGKFSTRDEGLRARFGAFALNRRAAEAVTVRAAATALLTAGGAGAGGEASVVVLGDLNDGPEAATTQILYGPPGSEIGTGGFDQPDQGDRQRLWNLAARIPEAQRFSREFQGRRELIDHILVSHTLVGLVADGAVTTDAAGPIVPRQTMLPGRHRFRPGSKTVPFGTRHPRPDRPVFPLVAAFR